MAGKTALIVLAHQERTSFNYAMKEAAVTVLKKEGWNVIESDLYAMQFNPVTSRDDITGNPKDPNHFKYGSETAKAWKEGRLTKDIVEEQKKIEMADLIIFQFPLYWFGTPAIMKGWFERVLCLDFAYNYKTLCSEGPFKNKKALLSFTTGSIQSMFSTSGIVGDINVILWPLQSGVLNSCGFKVLAPQISYAVAHMTQEVRVETLKSWEKRLETIWDEKTIKYLPLQDFEDFSGGLSLKKEVEESLSASKYAPTVGQNLGKPLPPDSQNKKALLSFTTGSLQSMFTPSGIDGDINVILWPLQNGVLNSCGFKVLAPQISYSVAHVSQEVRVETLKSWEKRLETIWDEKPIKYLPVKDFEDFSGGFSLKKEVEESLSASKYAPTVGQNLGKPLPPDSQVKAEGSRLS